MPIYEYKCKKCYSSFELKKGFNEPSGATCPHCQGEADRVFYPAPIIFKGSGFYVTDHKTSNSTLEDAGTKKADTDKPTATATTDATPAASESKKSADEKAPVATAVSDKK